MIAAMGTRAAVSLRDVLAGATVLWVALIPLVPHEVRVGSLPLLDVQRVGFLIVSALLLLRLRHGAAAGRTMNGMEVSIACFFGLVVLSWISTLPGKSLVTIKQDADFLFGSFVVPLTAYWSGRSIRWTPKRVAGCLALLLGLTGVFLAILGLIQGTYDWSFLVDASNLRMHPDRAKATFGNSIVFGLVAAMLLLPALHLYIQSRACRDRLMTVLIALGLTEAIVLSKARAVWIAAVVAVLFVAARSARVRGLVVVIVLLMVGQVGLGSLRSGVSSQEPRQMRGMWGRITEVEPVLNRVAVYATDINMIAHRPLLGFGFGLSTFEDNRDAYQTSCCGVPLRYVADCVVPHNELLNVLILTGAIGLLVYLLFVRGVWRFLAASAGKMPEDSGRASLALCLQAALVMLAIVGMAHDLMYVDYVQLLFFYLLGLLAGDWAAGEVAER
jgi:O-antigen ligase